MNDKFMKAISETVTFIIKPEVPSLTELEIPGIIDKKDNDAILKLLGTEYAMELRRDVNSGVLTVQIKNSWDHAATSDISERELITANHNILLWHIKRCILAIEELVSDGK